MKKKLIYIGFFLMLCFFAASTFLLFSDLDLLGRPKDNIDYPGLEKKGEIVLVTDYSTMGYYVKGDTVGGFSYELVKLLQTFTDIELKIELETSLQKSIEGLSIGRYNVIARNIPVTTELKDTILFSEPIAQTKQVLVQRKGEYNDSLPPLRSLLDLAKKTLYVAKKSPAILRIKNLSKEIGDTIYYVEDEFYGEEQLAIMVAQREIDYAVCDEKTANRIAESQPELDVATKIGFTQFEAWSVSQDSPILLDSLNAWILRAKSTDKYDELFKSYFDEK